MNPQTKRKLKETKTVLNVEGDAEETVLSIDAALKDGTKRTMKRPYSRGVASTSDDSSSSSSISTRLRSSRHKTKDDDVDVKPIFPPPIDLNVNQDKRTVEPVPFSKLRKEKYFVDKSELIRDIYMNKTRSKYYCFPRAACSLATIRRCDAGRTIEVFRRY